MIRKNPLGFISISICLLTVTTFSFIGCGSNSSSSAPVIPQAQNGTGQLVLASTGGSITFEAENGIKARLDIPANTLPEDTVISLTMSQSENEIEIITTPEKLKLHNAAKLIIDYATQPESLKAFKLFDNDGTENLRPLKQCRTENQISGTIYMLGALNAIVPDDSLVLEIADNTKNAETSTEWQELATTFNSLLWLCAYYRDIGDPDESSECMKAAVSKCEKGTEAFLILDTSDSKSYINSLEKLKYLMGLCENPGNIQARINDKYSGVSG